MAYAEGMRGVGENTTTATKHAKDAAQGSIGFRKNLIGKIV